MPPENHGSRFGGRPLLAVLIVAELMLFAPPATSIALPIDEGSATCELAIEFLEPRDWRCTNNDRDRCVACRNVSDHASELAVRCVDQTTAERRRVPPGAEISICRGEKTPSRSFL